LEGAECIARASEKELKSQYTSIAAAEKDYEKEISGRAFRRSKPTLDKAFAALTISRI